MSQQNKSHSMWNGVQLAKGVNVTPLGESGRLSDQVWLDLPQMQRLLLFSKRFYGLISDKKDCCKWGQWDSYRRF